MIDFMKKFMKFTDFSKRIRKFKNIFQTEFANIAQKHKLAHQKIALFNQNTSQLIKSSHNHVIKESLNSLSRIQRRRNQSKRIKFNLKKSKKKAKKDYQRKTRMIFVIEIFVLMIFFILNLE